MKLPVLPEGFVWGDTKYEYPDIRKCLSEKNAYVLVYSKEHRYIYGYSLDADHNHATKYFAKGIMSFEEAAPLMAQLLWLGQLECDIRGDPI